MTIHVQQVAKMQAPTKAIAIANEVVYLGAYLDPKICGPAANPIWPYELENTIAKAGPVARYVV